MKCETCFWSTKTLKGLACQYIMPPIMVGPSDRCANWRFDGRECCNNCHHFFDYHCVKNGPFRGEHENIVSEDEWCGQFEASEARRR